MGNKTENMNADIIFACLEEKYFRSEFISEHHALVRVLSGEIRMVQADKSHIFGAGDCFLLPRNQPATIIKYPKDGQPYKSILIYLRHERLKTFYTRHNFQATQPHHHRIKVFDKHLLLESLFASLLPYFDMTETLPADIVSVKVEEVITILRTLDGSMDGLLAFFDDPGKISLTEFMEQNYMFNMTLDKFGYLTGRSLTSFKRDFKKAFHTTPQKWLTEKRLALAHYHLTEKKRKPVDVYFEVGFENLSHFSYAFKKQYGYAPGESRDRIPSGISL